MDSFLFGLAFFNQFEIRVKTMNVTTVSKILKQLRDDIALPFFSFLCFLVGAIGLVCNIVALFAIAFASPPLILLIVVAGPFNLILTTVYILGFGFSAFGLAGLAAAVFMQICAFLLIKDAPLN